MGSARDEFYARLQTDYNEFGVDSAIYQYISNEHNRLVEHAIENSESVKSNILQIKYHWKLLISDKEEPEQYISNLLRILKKRPVLYQDTSQSTSVSFLVKLIATGLNLDAKDIEMLRQNKIKKIIHDKLIELVNKLDSEDRSIQNNIWIQFRQSGYLIKPYIDLQEITKIIIERATNVEIKSFFYDAGYPLTEYQYRTVNDKGEDKKNNLKHKQRNKIDKTLSIMDIYCKKRSFSLFSNESYPSFNDCETLFSLLVNSENDDVLIPLRVDIRTGCALYIIGRKFYECLYAEKRNFTQIQKFKKNNNACCYGILTLYSPFTEPLNASDHSVGYMLVEDFGMYSSFAEAFNEYQVECNNVLSQISEDYNQKLPVELPSVFKQYALFGELELTGEEISNMNNEINQEFEAFRLEQISV